MKVLLDTNVLIGFFRNPAEKESFESRAHWPLVFMSSVVALELLAGCRTPVQQKVVTSNAGDFGLIEKYTPVRWMLPLAGPKR
jgi:predicted nucleic acid-binding protein